MRSLFIKLFVFLGYCLLPNIVFAEETLSTSTHTSNPIGGYLAIAAGIGLGLAALGGTIGQGKAASAALEGIARNPEASSKIQLPMIVALALIESLVIYSLVISYLLMGKI